MMYYLRAVAIWALFFSMSACSLKSEQVVESYVRHPELRRNCPYLLSADFGIEDKQQVTIRPAKNTSYNAALGDECKSDFIRILEDLPKFAEYFEVYGSGVLIDFGDIFYAHDTRAGFVDRTRRDLSYALNSYRGINQFLQKSESLPRFDEMGTEPYDSEVFLPIANDVLREKFYRDYEYYLNRYLQPFDLRVLKLDLNLMTTVCRGYKESVCTNDFPFPNRWQNLEKFTYVLGGVRGAWHLTALEEFKPIYRNCPVIIKHKESSKGLHLWTDRHEGFNVDLPNECQGKVQAVWEDLKLFEPLLKKHTPNIAGQFPIGFYLEHFPDTQLEISKYLSSEVKKRSEDFGEAYDQNKLEDVLNLRAKYHRLIRERLPDYVNKNYVGPLNDYLTPHGIEMISYDIGEKMSFCIVKEENCILYFPRNDELMKKHPELDVFFLGTGDYGWRTKENIP